MSQRIQELIKKHGKEKVLEVLQKISKKMSEDQKQLPKESKNPLTNPYHLEQQKLSMESISRQQPMSREEYLKHQARLDNQLKEIEKSSKPKP